ncbi:SUMF1/EgtB/PvdO family nonheme iron enzyme [Cupriavidus basilensis]
MPGANWRGIRAASATRNITSKDDHPVVQVSHEDARRPTAKWAGKRLPHRGRMGVRRARQYWNRRPIAGATRFRPEGRQMANVWQGQQGAAVPGSQREGSGGAGSAPSQVGTVPGQRLRPRPT